MNFAASSLVGLTVTLIAGFVGTAAAAAQVSEPPSTGTCRGMACADGSTGPDGATAELVAREVDGPPPEPGTPEAAADPCVYRDDLYSPGLPQAEIDRILADNAQVEVDLEGPRLRGTYRDCGDGFVPILWWEGDDDADPVAPLLVEALAQVRPDAVPLLVEPPAQPGVVVGLPAYFSIDAAAASGTSASASDGGYTVTVSAQPTRLVIDTGEGEVACDPPGSVYVSGQGHPDGGCTHLYTTVPDGGSVSVSSYVVYGASYTVEGPGLSGTFELDAFDGPTTQTDVTVREVRAVRTR